MTEQQNTILRLYTINDRKIHRFLPPFFAMSDDEAKRLIGQEVNFKPSLMCSYPSDYDLFYVGNFDQSTGKLSFDDEVMFLVCNCNDLKIDDSVKYDELLLDVKKQQGQIDVSVMRFQQSLKDFENVFNGFIENSKSKLDSEISIYQDKIIDLNSNINKYFDDFDNRFNVFMANCKSNLDTEIKKTVELYVPVDNNKEQSSLLDKLFN